MGPYSCTRTQHDCLHTCSVARTCMEMRLLQHGVELGTDLSATSMYKSVCCLGVRACPGPDLVSFCSSSHAQLEESPCKPFRPAACRGMRGVHHACYLCYSRHTTQETPFCSDLRLHTWNLPQSPSMHRPEAVYNDLKHRKSSQIAVKSPQQSSRRRGHRHAVLT